jgi:ubiquinone/menaquinone biosynthesis C-methylase UbiE
MGEAEIERFWNAHPCGDTQVGGLTGDHEDLFSRYDALRYRNESHIPGCLDQINFENKEVLEIGLGQGAESEQIIRRGAKWNGIDLTKESCDRVRMRLQIRNLPHRKLVQGSVLDLPFPDRSIDIIFSHGVLHHVPDVKRAQEEISRVIKPSGQLIIMVYSKYSINYLISIFAIRRLGLATMYLLGRSGKGIYASHLENARKYGLWSYLKMENFIHRNTDGPLNPYSKVYGLRDLEVDFPRFRLLHWHKEHMHAPPLRISGLPGARYLGWHLWAHMQRR